MSHDNINIKDINIKDAVFNEVKAIRDNAATKTDIQNLNQEHEKKYMELTDTITKQNESIEKLATNMLDNSIQGTNNINAADKATKGFIKALTTGNTKEYTKESGLVIQNNPEGGALAPVEFVNKLHESIFHEDKALNLVGMCDIIETDTMSIKIPIQNATVVWSANGECKPAKQTTPRFGTNVLTAKKRSAHIESSWEFMNFQNVYTEAKIVEQLKDSLLASLNYDIINGTGTDGNNDTFLGILNDERVEVIDGGGAALDFDALYDLYYTLKQGNEPVFLMNRKTRNALNKIKGTDGQYVANRLMDLPPILNNGLGKITIGKQVAGSEILTPVLVDMIPDGEIVLCDLKRGYKMLLNKEMRLIKDVYTQAKSDCMAWTAHYYSDGQISLPDAFIRLTNIDITNGAARIKKQQAKVNS